MANIEEQKIESNHVSNNEEVLLEGGGRTKVSRRGKVVLREAGAWSGTVQRLLRHLDEVGFEAAPRVVGTGFDEQGRETLTYIEGEFVHPGPWSDKAVYRIGQVLRQLHMATASFVVPADAVWRSWFGRELGGTPAVIGHCDMAPWNLVAREGKPIGLIDWEVAGPVDPLVELAQVCWLNAQLYDDDVAAMAGLPSLKERAQQVRLILDGYGLGHNERAGFIDKIIEFAVFDAAEQAIEVPVTPETVGPEPLWGLAYRTRSAAWMMRHRLVLERVLV